MPTCCIEVNWLESSQVPCSNEVLVDLMFDELPPRTERAPFELKNLRWRSMICP